MDDKLTNAFDILYSKRSEMESFMGHYVFDKMNIDKNKFLDDKVQFMAYIDFCLHTAQRTQNKNIENGTIYFDKKYVPFMQALKKMKLMFYNKLYTMPLALARK
jgi:hypothetical protein